MVRNEVNDLARAFLKLGDREGLDGVEAIIQVRTAHRVLRD
jgi:hypothetical protein